MTRSFRRLVPGQPIVADEMNRALAEIERLAQSTIDNRLGQIHDATGDHVRNPALRWFYAELTEQPGGPSGSGGSGSGSDRRQGYAYREGNFDHTGDWYLVEAGRKGTTTERTAYELNDLLVPLETNMHPTRVQMFETDEDYVIFDSRGAAAGSGSGYGGGHGIPISELIKCNPSGTGTIIRDAVLTTTMRPDGSTGLVLRSSDGSTLFEG